jgi:dolichol-phosphate mannosyltransferase
MVRFATDGVLSFSLMPLRFATTLGLIASTMALIGIVYAIYARFFTTWVLYGWTLPFVASLFLGGAQLICLGIIGEYIGRIYREGKQRPMYLVESSRGFEDLGVSEKLNLSNSRAA